jgi:hypothetical protein
MCWAAASICAGSERSRPNETVVRTLRLFEIEHGYGRCPQAPQAEQAAQLRSACAPVPTCDNFGYACAVAPIEVRDRIWSWALSVIGS